MKRVALRLDKEVYDAIKNAAAQAGQTESEFIRRILETRSQKLLAALGVETNADLVRTETRNVLLNMENRLIKVLAKATGAAAANMYLSVQCIAQANKRDAAETHQRARAKAVEYLKTEGKE